MTGMQTPKLMKKTFTNENDIKIQRELNISWIKRKKWQIYEKLMRKNLV